MNALNWLDGHCLEQTDFNRSTEFLMQDFLPKNMITLFYADGGNGKSWLAFALAKICAKKGLDVAYLDFDNPLSVLKDRNVPDLLIQPFANLRYIQRSKSTSSPVMLLEQLSQLTQTQRFDNCVFFIDSLRNFTSLTSDNQIQSTLDKLMNLRDAGATVIIIHHSNKNGENYQGSNHIRNSVDNMYRLEKVESEPLTLHLQVKKERAAILDQLFELDTRTLTLTHKPLDSLHKTDEQEAFNESVIESLTESKKNKTELLASVGRKKDDKTARKWLDEGEETLWHSSKSGNVISYQLVEQQLALTE